MSIRAEMHNIAGVELRNNDDNKTGRFSVVQIRETDGNTFQLFLSGTQGVEAGKKIQAALLNAVAFLESDNV